MMTLGERGARIRQKRQALKLSAYRAATLAGVHPNSVIYAEKGAASAVMTARLEAALGLAAEARS